VNIYPFTFVAFESFGPDVRGGRRLMDWCFGHTTRYNYPQLRAKKRDAYRYIPRQANILLELPPVYPTDVWAAGAR
jgi:hypothetical protein